MHDLLRACAREQAAARDSGGQCEQALTRLFDYYMAAAAGRLRAGQRVLEPGHIQLTGLQAHHIATRPGGNPGAARLGQLTDRDQLARVQQQRRQHRPRLAARNRHGQPIAAHHQRAKQAKL
jgi:hypothetical protein